ncbi:4-hydroxy-tetrahydrodipicolinate reductase [Cupriavidus metallidurans]|uniref:4-hydroxy-tetrahydrodipicolinate reductase n=1 Tax=Cupriavidus TaxID=106589 RepID=UPI0002A284A5|nr:MULTISPECIES: 4-hydroxy-tetrahydrodipicolinate reductase [Cupriavidus]ELA00338.1 dihydrodipicolinate reductase [Cupriavidus sp. HMR-1]GMG91382.1 4-hydroxy-tetrahydrodipicolinate reductase [Cupriavidus sp. TKC]HBD33506.1 4-hydroxy-tetrahydrodipicolinate reductase [Cupriavidus sp.]HBO77559.1 4-hydroxy-tetrahydrodipicolinate reductase [Cupriavidus sp.]
MNNDIRVAVGGVTGWAGGELARGVAHAADMTLVAGLSRGAAGQALAKLTGHADTPGIAVASIEELNQTPYDVYVEYTEPVIGKHNILQALARGAHVVVGTSGLTDDDYVEIDAAARKADRGVLACGNFAITVVLLQKFAEMAARHLEHWEIIDYAKAGKVDVPSGTVRELAFRLGQVKAAAQVVPIDELNGPKETRGATMSGTQVHAVRLPGYQLGVEVIFGADGQRLHLKHEAGDGSKPYVSGALLAIRKVHTVRGVVRGLDKVMEGL